MPTGYTAGIIDGTTKYFNEYAKQCERAFLIHMRDEPFNSDYIPITPSDYHSKAIVEAEKQLKKVKELKDSEIIAIKKESLLNKIKRYKEEIVKKRDVRNKLELFLVKAKGFKPPTDKHTGIADFMQDQLTKTIDFDCNEYYHIEELKNSEKELLNINADTIRNNMEKEANKDLEYHNKEYKAELKRCEDSNKWHDDFINALD